jgi:aspartate kinase
MQVFKFGGASVKSAENIKNVVSIVEKHRDSSLLIVVSAIGKTTDKLVRITESYLKQDGECFALLDQLKQEHFNILNELFPDPTHPVYDDIANTFVEIEWILEEEPQDDYDYLYDQIVSV